MSKPILWIVIPCYNEEAVLPITAPMFKKKLEDLAKEGLIAEESRVLFVNDGSKDTSPEILGQYMHSMTIIRNLCAHGSRIYNRLFEQKPSLNKKEQALLIRREDGTMDNAHFFGFFLIMRRLLPAENFAEMKEAVIALTEKYPFVRMDYYGFRDDWKEKL